VFGIRRVVCDKVVSHTGTKQSPIMHCTDVVCLCNDAQPSDVCYVPSIVASVAHFKIPSRIFGRE
jgi:hypothetical protein